ncbi:MAG: hypothetical protein Q8O67_24860 [Deltaproteobacteria bacterium]|nr:hypothetical protein [Deltaproteobacteria bacterium]
MRRLLLPLIVFSSCATPPEPTTTTTAALPAWMPVELARDPALDEAAALLCARDTDAVVDDDVRAAARVFDGRVVGILASSVDEAALQAGSLFAGAGYSHVGLVDGVRPGGSPCVAVVASRRIVSVSSLPPAFSRAGQAPPAINLSVPSSRIGHLFVLSPDGFVDRLPLVGTELRKLPLRKEGRHVVEVIVDDVDADGVPKGNPEVALLWPYVRGNLGLPPSPAVLFPDAGHDDLALSHRAEALVQRLRNEQLLETLKISPLLTEAAVERARAIGGVLGHRVDGKSPRQLLDDKFPGDPRALFIRLGEVQARGSTLSDAWAALTDSPAHRFELVSMGVTHMGVAVVRGQDPLGRTTITLVTLLGRRPPPRDVVVLQKKLLDDANSARVGRGYDPLVVSESLESAARRLARQMMESRRVDDTLLGGPIGEVALEADASLTKVLPLVARIDDPLLLGTFAPLVDIDTTALGVGLALHPEEGVFYVVVLAGVGGS